jgi:serine/threonine protein kinase
MIDRVGQQLGNYRLIRLLGKGGFAEVYLGEHLRLGTHAAVKVLYTRLANNEEVERFEKEARTIAHLEHPHIVRVLDFDVVDGIPFLVMSYATGGTLRQRHPKGTVLPLTTIITYVKQVADALQYAHDQHLIHRDVKPENMLVGRRDEVLLSDFGIAIVAQSSRYQSTQEMVGTMAYMAPEQIQGKPRLNSDQYSLGIVVYEWLSGDRPFHGSLTEIVAQHLAVLPPHLREKVPTVSADVERVVLKALEKDPRQRFESVQEFVQVLAAAVEQLGPIISTITPTIRAIPPHNAPPVPQKTKEQWLNEGDAHHNDGRYKEAIAAYDRAIQLDPNDPYVYYNRGNAYSKLKEYQQAIADYDRAIAFNPNNADVYNNRGIAYFGLTEYQQAIADYDRAIALDPKYAPTYFNRGEAYHRLRKPRRAIADYDRAIALDPNDAPTYFNRGEAYSDLEEYQQAIADYTRTIALDPTYALAYAGRGFAYFGVKHYRRAIQDYDHALKLDPNITWVHVARDEVYQMLKRQ